MGGKFHIDEAATDIQNGNISKKPATVKEMVRDIIREEEAAKLRKPLPRISTKTPRNILCHCGSGRKYKKCHGRSR